MQRQLQESNAGPATSPTGPLLTLFVAATKTEQVVTPTDCQTKKLLAVYRYYGQESVAVLCAVSCFLS